MLSVWCSLLGSAVCLAADGPLQIGDSLIERNGVSMALHIPATLEGAHGPSGVLVFIGGSGDSNVGYQRSLGKVADALEIALVVPQMPWFRDGTNIPVPTIFKGLDSVVDQIEKQFSLKPGWIFVGGASAGGKSATDLAAKWSSNTQLLLLASTGPFSDVRRSRTLHVVAENEMDRLGPRGRRGSVLGKGKVDLFAIPGGQHSAQIKHLTVWLETEISILRMEESSATLRQAEDALRAGKGDEARAILRSTREAVTILGTPTAESDEFFQYETQRRKELLEKYSATIRSLEAVEAKL